MTQKYNKNFPLTFFHLLSTGCKRFAGDVVKGWVTESYKGIKIFQIFVKKKNMADIMQKSSTEK